MFETLEPPEQLVARRWPLLMYGTYSLAGLVFLIVGIRRHGFSHPFALAIAAVMFILSVVWLVTALIKTELSVRLLAETGVITR